MTGKPACLGCQQSIAGKVRRGRCENCYRAHLRQLKRAGEYEPLLDLTGLHHPGQAVLQRVEKMPDGCWLYTGALTSDGYGVRVKSAFLGGRRIQPHRAVYEFTVGPIPPELELDHLCHTRDEECLGGRSCQHRRCVNPDHLEPVAGVENNIRSKSPTSFNAKKTHCIRGHEFTPENTKWRMKRKGKVQPCRQCRKCIILRRNRSRGRL